MRPSVVAATFLLLTGCAVEATNGPPFSSRDDAAPPTMIEGPPVDPAQSMAPPGPSAGLAGPQLNGAPAATQARTRPAAVGFADGVSRGSEPPSHESGESDGSPIGDFVGFDVSMRPASIIPW